MPERYEAIRDSLKERGMGTAEAKTRAARIYNASRKSSEAPVTRDYEHHRGRKNALATLRPKER